MRSRVVSFCVVCVVTVVVVVLFVLLDLPSALNTPILQQQVTARDQDTRQWVHQDKHEFIKKSADDTGAIHVRRKMLRKISPDRAAELELHVDSLHVPATNETVQPLQSNVEVPSSKQQQSTPQEVVAVVVSGSVQPKTVLPSNRNLSYHQKQLAVHDTPSTTESVLATESTQSSEEAFTTEAAPTPEKGFRNLTANCCVLSHQALINVSQSNNIDERGTWQRERVEAYCSRHGLNWRRDTLPHPDTRARHNLLRHVMFDDRRKFIFTFLPKVGCTNTRRFMFVLSGAIPLETIHWKKVPEEGYLHPGILKSTLLNPTLTDQQRIEKIKTYWKFVILRHPLERLVSAFRNKLESPLLYSGIYSLTFEMHKRQILERYQPRKLQAWFHDKGSYNLSVDFQTYIRWVVEMPDEKLNEHFCPMILLAQPCRIRYHFFANFKRLSSEMQLVMDKYSIPTEYFYDHSKYQPGQDTSNLVQDYYSTLSDKLKLALLKDFSQELEFYYMLFPEDEGTHFELLGLNAADISPKLPQHLQHH